MKIKKYLDDCNENLPPELAEILISEGSIWTNEACYGYCVSAMKAAGLKKSTIDKMIHCLHNAFDTMGVEEAEEFWHKF